MGCMQKHENHRRGVEYGNQCTSALFCNTSFPRYSARCKWNLSEGEPWRLFSEVSPGPPMECSIEAARPRCDSEIRYSITSLQASSFSCRQGVGHMPLEFPQRVEFRGRVCGYDLIQWESVKIPLEPESVCEIDRQGSPCGGIPHGEHLPHGCLHLAEPAVFEMRTTWFTVQATSRYSCLLYTSPSPRDA